MPDLVDPETRSRMMSGIRGKDTKPELLIRKGLYARGLRYRLHVAKLPGKPDLVLPRYRAAIFVHGCFWHGHNCHLFRLPSTRRDFWKAKIARNSERDMEVRKSLKENGWRTLVVWECALKGRTRRDPGSVLDSICAWLADSSDSLEISGGLA